MLPLMQIWQVDFAISINVFASFYHHGTCRFDKTYGRVVGICVQQPQTHWDVVDIAYKKHKHTKCLNRLNTAIKDLNNYPFYKIRNFLQLCLVIINLIWRCFGLCLNKYPISSMSQNRRQTDRSRVWTNTIQVYSLFASCSTSACIVVQATSISKSL